MASIDNLNFIEFLKNRLNKPLPGIQSQIKMAMRIGNSIFRKLQKSPTARNSSVMIILNGINELKIIFTLRSSSLKNHSHQISFPGGRCDMNEEEIDTAIRETQEEIGLKISKNEIIGKLSELYVPPSNNNIIPFIAYKQNIEELTINPVEVEEIINFELHKFIEPEYKKIKTLIIDGFDVETPYWDIHQSIPLWGATSMILSELIDIYIEWLNLK